MDFSDRVRSRMQALHLSAVELAQLVGVTKSSVTHWTTGSNQASGKRLLALAKALECDVAWLAMGEGHPTGEAGKHRYASTTSANKGKDGTAAFVLEMLKLHAGKSLNNAARQRIAQAVADSLETQLDQAGKQARPSISQRDAEAEFCIPHFDLRTIHHSQLPAEHAEAIRSVILNKTYLQRLGLLYSSADQLAVVTCWDKGMEGTLNEGDAVIVDCGVKAFIGDGIYLVSWANHTFMRRLLLAGSEQLELIPDNTKHKQRLVPQGDVTVHAKALVNMRMQAL